MNQPTQTNEPCVTLTPRETAVMLGFSYWKLLEMCKRGEIPHVRIGNLVFFRKSTVLEWLQKMEEKSVHKDEVKEEYGKLRKINKLLGWI